MQSLRDVEKLGTFMGMRSVLGVSWGRGLVIPRFLGGVTKYHEAPSDP